MERAFANFRQAQVEAVLVTASPIYLASFGPVIAELRTRVGAIAAQVLRGARPADIPIEQPKRCELALNLKTARASGVTIPQTVRRCADEVFD